MRSQLVHRGPDSDGEYADSHCVLGVRRLRIIDLVTGDMPQHNEDRTVWTVFNGEIYNFRELRDALASRGHRFENWSDTEVIVHLYEDYGDRFVEHLDGMFAIALWDSSQRRLVLARDRLGKKPLLYREANGIISFASEHQALLAADPTPRTVDPLAIQLYLRLGYVPAPHDAFVGVRKLPPAHTLTWQDGASHLSRYWAPPAYGTSVIQGEDAPAEVRRLLDAAVGRRLVADVPVGAFLSGGVDSSILVASMASQRTRVRTFSIGFDERGYSELAHARRVATMFGTEHEEMVVRPQALEILPLLVRHFGEPFADSSAIPTYYLSKLARRHVTVALAGDGGDELFAGYDRYRAASLGAHLDLIPTMLRGPIAAAAGVVPQGGGRTRKERALRFFRAAMLPPAERYLTWLGVFDAAAVERLMSPHWQLSRSGAEAVLRERLGGHGGDRVAAAQRTDLSLYLPDDLLVKVDIASMACSLEVRSPFLDRHLVEYAVALPTRLNLGKRILKQAYAGVVPPKNLSRRKQGFGVPVAAWLRGELRPLMLEVVLSPRAAARGWFQMAEVSRLVREHDQGRVDHGSRLWALLILELWNREFIDG